MKRAAAITGSEGRTEPRAPGPTVGLCPQHVTRASTRALDVRRGGEGAQRGPAWHWAGLSRGHAAPRSQEGTGPHEKSPEF